MPAGRGFRRLWLVVSAVWFALCVGYGLWEGYEPAQTIYCQRSGHLCLPVDPLDVLSSDPAERERWQHDRANAERVEIPARVNPRPPALGALIGVTGSALLYGVGWVLVWIARGFREK